MRADPLHGKLPRGNAFPSQPANKGESVEKANGIITITTDFGDADGFVGTMKGVILSRYPLAQIVDIAHHIPRQDVIAGALVLGRACLEFPPGTVHLAVIDPGVGSKRAGIIAETEDDVFILPDNGLITFVAQKREILRVHRLENQAYRLEEISQTFHGRDVFAPAAAHAAAGVRPEAFGPAQAHPLLLDWPQPRREEKRFFGEIMSFDIYGNALTNLPNTLVQSGSWRMGCGEVSLFGPATCYQDHSVGQPLFLKGSMGFLEIATREESARTRLALRRGQTVTLEKLPTRERA